MVTWTQVEIDSVKAAILALSTGSALASVSFADRAVQYRQADLTDLIALLSAMEGVANGTPSYRLAATSKGTGWGGW